MGAPANRDGALLTEINVTPLVDVVLVLLIIFMVVTPLLSKQLWLQLPKQETQAAEPPKDSPSVVLTVKKDGLLEINGAPIERAALKDRIARFMAARADKVVYFDAADDAPYAVTVDAMDIAKQGGAKTIAILTQKVAR